MSKCFPTNWQMIHKTISVSEFQNHIRGAPVAARQEVLNVLLAQLLEEGGLVSAPEQIIHTSKNGGKKTNLPDVLVDLQGLRMAIEAEFASTTDAPGKAYDKAKERVEHGLAHIGVAVVYPAKLRQVTFKKQKQELAASRLQFRVITEAADIPVQPELFPGVTPSFDRGNVQDLAESLRNSYEQLIKDTTLELAVEKIEAIINVFIEAVRGQPATTERMAVVLGIRESPEGKPVSRLTAQESAAVNRIGSLIVVNAMIFQEVLSKKEQRVKPLRHFEQAPDPVGQIRTHWHFILNQVNYFPIFHTAFGILDCLAADPDMRRTVEGMVRAALWIVNRRASLRHDLAGRIFHRVLAEAKYLGAYYTSIPSATLLLKLAIGRNGGSFDWSSLDAVKEMTIADLACGTGTLLMAAADAVLDNYLRACGRENVPPQIEKLHSDLVEKVIYGFDVLPSAIHLTASTLSLRVPDMPINATHLSSLNLGGEAKSLGSLDFFSNSQIAGTLFSKPLTATGKPGVPSPVSMPDVDLCVMNPPFTRSVGGNLLFGNLPESERLGLQKKLKQLVNRQSLQANITAGLGSAFIALADRYIRANGCLAIVLPRALISGVAWKKTRDIINAKYQLEYVIVSHDPKQWNFSENTSLSEVLVIARKRASEAGARTICINLWKQPQNAVEALAAARSVQDAEVPDVVTGQGSLSLLINGRKTGEAIAVPWKDLQKGMWNFPCAFAQADLVRTLYHLRNGRLSIPGKSEIADLPVCPMTELGDFGYDRRDMHDAFDLANGETVYPALWGHEGSRIRTIRQAPNQYLDPLSRAKAGRNLRSATHLMKKAGRLLIVERFRLNTMKLTAVRLAQRSLSNVWWTFTPRSEGVVTEKVLALWLNSTLGIILMLGYREETEGAWIDFKKPVLKELPVLDPRALSGDQIQTLLEGYDACSHLTIECIPEMETDKTRIAIDTVISEALDLPDLKDLRSFLCREPVITLDSRRLAG